MDVHAVGRLALASATVAAVLGLAAHGGPPGSPEPSGRPDTALVAARAQLPDGPLSGSTGPGASGLVPLAGARGVVADAADLGAIHADPVPDGSDRAGTRLAGLREHVAPSCSGTGTDGNRVQVLYVHQVGGPSRYARVLPTLRNEVANVDDVFAVSAQQTGGQRRVRWVHDAGCRPVIKDVTLPRGALGSDFWGTIAALKKLGFTNPHRKYLMFADATQLCGIGTFYDDDRTSGNANDGTNASYSRVDSGCWSASHSVAAHELTHNLGGVQPHAPHATRYGHCFDESDLMCYDDGSGTPMRTACAAAQEQLLDCGHEDYFNTRPAPSSFLARHWNTARSSFLDSVLTPPR
jgi:hypothetical protein